MAVKSLGKITVTTGGTPVQVSTTRVGANSIMFQQIPGNTGKMYIGDSTLVKATLVGVHAVLPIPTTNILPSYTATIVEAPAGLNAAEFWVDAEVNGEGVLVSYTQQ
jgi:hypothetical protein